MLVSAVNVPNEVEEVVANCPAMLRMRRGGRA